MAKKLLPEFDPNRVLEKVYVRFVKYAERFKNNHLKVNNITDEAQQRSLFLVSVGETPFGLAAQEMT